MPYGLSKQGLMIKCYCSFNPSYGLHALRAYSIQVIVVLEIPVSIPHMGCMPYGQDYSPKPNLSTSVSIPHMGCMPYGLDGVNRIGEIWYVSIPHMGCMPYGRVRAHQRLPDGSGFNPSYGLHALRAEAHRLPDQLVFSVSIPHMGCMPYGLPDPAGNGQA